MDSASGLTSLIEWRKLEGMRETTRFGGYADGSKSRLTHSFVRFALDSTLPGLDW